METPGWRHRDGDTGGRHQDGDKRGYIKIKADICLQADVRLLILNSFYDIIKSVYFMGELL